MGKKIMTRADAIARARQHLQSGEFLKLLDRRVGYRTESQNPRGRDALRAYLVEELTPAFSALDFATRLIESPSGKGPCLLANYVEDAALPTLLTYGHGDVVDGMAGEWRDNLDPWRTTTVGARVYGRGTADNKGQHSINLSALSAVRDTRGGKLGFNTKFIIETGEEIGSPELRQVCEGLREELKADLFLASDGPRLSADQPTIFLGCRGGLRIHLDVNLREGAHHSGNWGGVLANAATILASAIASLVDEKGRMQLDQLKPPRISNQIRAVLADVKVEPTADEPALSPDWG
jgi:acetylornithine deacetylase/succinyl-diaminopimelate desuccinylase-like protein